MTFSCAAPGGIQGAGWAGQSKRNKREGRGCLGVGNVSTTVCRVLEGWVGNYPGSGPPHSDLVSTFSQKQNKIGCYKIAFDCHVVSFGLDTGRKL